MIGFYKPYFLELFTKV